MDKLIPEDITLDEIERWLNILDGNKIEDAILRGHLLNKARELLRSDNEFGAKRYAIFADRYSQSSYTNFMNLARCYTTEDYPKNYGQTALYELTARKNDDIRDEILKYHANTKSVTKAAVSAAADLIRSGAVPEPGTSAKFAASSDTFATDDCAVQSDDSGLATAEPRSSKVSIRVYREKLRRYDLRSPQDAKSFLQFAKELVAEHHDPSFVAETLRDLQRQPIVIDMDLQANDADTDHAGAERVVSANNTNLVRNQRVQDFSAPIRKHRSTIRQRPMTEV